MKLKLFLGVVIATAMTTPVFAQFGFQIVWDPRTMAQVVQDIQQARKAYALEQQIHAFISNPGSWRYLLQAEAMQMGRMAGIPPNLLNASDLLLLSQSRQSAIEALNRAATIGNVTNENATLGSLLGIQAAQAAVQQRQIQAQIDSDTQVDTYLRRGTGIGPQAAKIAAWEVK